MKYITPDNHPSHVATITASPDTIIEAANEVFELIHLEHFSAVTVHMPEDLVEETVKIAAQNPNIRDNKKPDFEFKNGQFADARNKSSTLSLQDIENLYGPNYATMIKFSSALGPGRASVTSTDIPTISHLDTFTQKVRDLSSYFSNLAENTKAPQSGLSVTMTQKRIGTGIITPIEGELSRLDKDAQEIFELTGLEYPSDNWHWYENEDHPIKTRTSYAKQNTITVLRSKEWQSTHTAAPHIAAERPDNGNPHTGIIGIAQIYPMA